MRTTGTNPTLDELHQAFADLLDRAATLGAPTPIETWLHPKVLDAVDDVARAWPHASDELIAQARRRFARYERTHSTTRVH